MSSECSAVLDHREKEGSCSCLPHVPWFKGTKTRQGPSGRRPRVLACPDLLPRCPCVPVSVSLSRRSPSHTSLHLFPFVLCRRSARLIANRSPWRTLAKRKRASHRTVLYCTGLDRPGACPPVLVNRRYPQTFRNPPVACLACHIHSTPYIPSNHTEKVLLQLKTAF